jgi:hypothetical protein
MCYSLVVVSPRAQPDEAKEGGAVGVVQWGEREELKDLYALFCAAVSYRRRTQHKELYLLHMNKGLTIISDAS